MNQTKRWISDGTKPLPGTNPQNISIVKSLKAGQHRFIGLLPKVESLQPGQAYALKSNLAKGEYIIVTDTDGEFIHKLQFEGCDSHWFEPLHRYFECFGENGVCCTYLKIPRKTIVTIGVVYSTDCDGQMIEDEAFVPVIVPIQPTLYLNHLHKKYRPKQLLTQDLKIECKTNNVYETTLLDSSIWQKDPVKKNLLLKHIQPHWGDILNQAVLQLSEEQFIDALKSSHDLVQTLKEGN